MPKNASIGNLKKLTQRVWTEQDDADYAEALLEESDRSIALMSVHQLDKHLRELFEALMIGLSQDEYDRLFTGQGPLASFGHKIQLGYALGLYPAEVAKNLDHMRQIRNVFAHSHGLLSFDTPEIAAVCKLFPAPPPDDCPYSRFMYQTYILSLALVTKAIEIIEAKLPAPEKKKRAKRKS